MRISDWSSDVCSSDLGLAAGDDAYDQRVLAAVADVLDLGHREIEQVDRVDPGHPGLPTAHCGTSLRAPTESFAPDRKSVVSGKSVSVRVDLGGRRIIKKKQKKPKYIHRPTKST